MFFLFLCKHLWDSSGTIFAIFQHCHHCLQNLEADNHFHTQFPGHNQPIYMDWVLDLMISRGSFQSLQFCDSVISWSRHSSFNGLSRTWFVSFTSLLPLLKCATHCHTVLTSILLTSNTQQALMKVIHMEVHVRQRGGIEFLHAEEMAPTDIYWCLLNIYGDQTVGVSTLKCWWCISVLATITVGHLWWCRFPQVLHVGSCLLLVRMHS